MVKFDYKEYYRKAKDDICELKKDYPYTKVIIHPYALPSPIELYVVAANNKLIHECNGAEEDFKGAFSRELSIVMPFDYLEKGCDVFGGAWIDLNKIPEKDHHFNGRSEKKQLFCVGVTRSFNSFRNVLLENVKTAENMLIAYENFQRGISEKVELIAYAHGEVGELEYRKNKRRYKTK